MHFDSAGVVYGSQIERWLLLFYILAAALIVIVANGLVIAVIVRFPRFHDAHHAVLVSSATADILLNLFAAFGYLRTWSLGALPWGGLCRIAGCLGIGAFFNTIYHVGLLATERGVYHQGVGASTR